MQMIPAYSPQARGRSERSFRTWQGRLPEELRLAGIVTVEGANAFLRTRYLAAFNDKFTVAAREKGTAFRKTARKDLNWIFTVQTERVVGKDKHRGHHRPHLAVGEEPVPEFLGGMHVVTIHEHLDGNVSIRFGPHVVGRLDAQGQPLRVKAAA